jgi:hypothetical protein
MRLIGFGCWQGVVSRLFALVLVAVIAARGL